MRRGEVANRAPNDAARGSSLRPQSTEEAHPGRVPRLDHTGWLSKGSPSRRVSRRPRRTGNLDQLVKTAWPEHSPSGYSLGRALPAAWRRRPRLRRSACGTGPGAARTAAHNRNGRESRRAGRRPRPAPVPEDVPGPRAAGSPSNAASTARASHEQNSKYQEMLSAGLLSVRKRRFRTAVTQSMARGHGRLHLRWIS